MAKTTTSASVSLCYAIKLSSAQLFTSLLAEGTGGAGEHTSDCSLRARDTHSFIFQKNLLAKQDETKGSSQSGSLIATAVTATGGEGATAIKVATRGGGATAIKVTTGGGGRYRSDRSNQRRGRYRNNGSNQKRGVLPPSR